MKSHYEVLGVEQIATDEEIKKAYKEMALKYHPDKSRLRNAEERFRQIQRAYEILKDNKKREIYDQFGDDGLNTADEGSNDTRLEKSFSMDEISKPRAKRRVGPRNEKLSASNQDITGVRKRRVEKNVTSPRESSKPKRQRSKSRTRRKSLIDQVDASSKVVAKIVKVTPNPQKDGDPATQSSSNSVQSSAFVKIGIMILLTLAVLDLLKKIVYGVWLLMQVAINVVIIAILYFVLTGKLSNAFESGQHFVNNFWSITTGFMINLVQNVRR